MKAKKLFSVISFFLVVLGASAGTHGIMIREGNVKYTVTIQTNQVVVLPNVHFFVVITDENGRRVTTPQQVSPSIKTYYLSEPGPVTGTRIARLIEVHNSDYYLPFYCEPDVKTGTFQNGALYNFYLNPNASIPK